MARCVLCAFVATHGYLCDAHRKAIAVPSLTAEQLATSLTHGPAALVDPWGTPWPLTASTEVGRSLDTVQLAILHPSVSAAHAALVHEHGAWSVHDRGSRNGTFVDRERVDAAVLTVGARLRFGEVAFYFVDRPLAPLARPSGPGRTAPSRADQLIFTASLRTASGVRLELSQRIEGGVVRVDPDSRQVQIDLGRLEFRLLQVLTEARRAVADPDQAYVPWPQVAEQLDFRSHGADSENVRELVRRVRRKLQGVGVVDLIESRHGVGYRLASTLEDDDG